MCVLNLPFCTMNKIHSQKSEKFKFSLNFFVCKIHQKQLFYYLRKRLSENSNLGPQMHKQYSGFLGLNFSTFWNQFCSQCFSKDNHGDGWRDNRSLINSIYSAEVNLITKFEARWFFPPRSTDRQSETHQGFILSRSTL